MTEIMIVKTSIMNLMPGLNSAIIGITMNHEIANGNAPSIVVVISELVHSKKKTINQINKTATNIPAVTNFSYTPCYRIRCNCQYEKKKEARDDPRDRWFLHARNSCHEITREKVIEHVYH